MTTAASPALTPSAPARRSQAERVDTMRRRLLEAATSVLGEKGLNGFRTADVIEAAGVSKGALLHHFATKDALIVAVFEHLYGQISASSHQPSKATNLSDAIDELIADSHAFFFSGSFQVSLDITVAAARHPQLRDQIFDVVRASRKDAEEMWVERLEAFGIAPADALDAVWIINSTIRGFAVRALWEPDHARFAHVEQVAARLVLAHLTKPD